MTGTGVLALISPDGRYSSIMGKSSRRRAQRAQERATQTAPTDDPGAAIVHASRRFVEAMEAYSRAINQVGDDADVIALPEVLDIALAYVAHGNPRRDVAALAEAWYVVNSRTPVAAMFSRYGRDGNVQERRWDGPLLPDQILHAAQIAPPDAVDYRTQLRENVEFYTRRGPTHDEKCGRPTKAGRDCQLLPVYVPAVGFLDANPCWRHITDEESTALQALYESAVADHDCPGCLSPAGVHCLIGEDLEHPQTVDGAYPKARKHADIQAHDVRLDKVTTP